MQKLKVLDLFSGIGGFSLGLERTGGFETVAFCEIEDYPRKVLKKHWPNVPCFDDVTKLKGEDVGPVDVICGGFPCQDLSSAGRGAGIGEGTRSSLFRHMLRLAVECGCPIIIFENVSRLLSGPSDNPGQWFYEFLRALAEIGYDAEWFCITAASVGAPHERDRIWVVAYPSQLHCNAIRDNAKAGDGQKPQLGNSSCADIVAYPHKASIKGGSISRRVYEEHANIVGAGWWQAEPGMGRVAHGIPNQAHRLGCLGNGLVPLIPELIGRAILSAIQDSK